jgi:RNA methyltransferase, TrmH family
MVSKGLIKLIVSLQYKKYREEKKLFAIEGDKIVNEFLAAGITIKTLIALPEFIETIPSESARYISETVPSTYEELKKVSTLKSPHNAVAIIEIPPPANSARPEKGELALVLDSVQDPGNMGTIIRAAAWFGVKNIYCSRDSADLYNPKVIQATMGAILNVTVHYLSLDLILKSALDDGIPVYGAVLEGKPLYSETASEPGLILLGNESKGISSALLHFVTKKITIPRSGVSGIGVESLNVGMAASIILSEFRRRDYL